MTKFKRGDVVRILIDKGVHKRGDIGIVQVVQRLPKGDKKRGQTDPIMMVNVFYRDNTYNLYWEGQIEHVGQDEDAQQ